MASFLLLLSMTIAAVQGATTTTPMLQPQNLIQFPLLSRSNLYERRRQRLLQGEDQEDEGQPQQVDALYQGYGMFGCIDV